MSTERTNDTPTGDRIALDDSSAAAQWARKFDVTEQQIQDAVATVGDKAADVELHLKGTRSSTNDDRIEEAGAGND